MLCPPSVPSVIGARTDPRIKRLWRKIKPISGPDLHLIALFISHYCCYTHCQHQSTQGRKRVEQMPILKSTHQLLLVSPWISCHNFAGSVRSSLLCNAPKLVGQRQVFQFVRSPHHSVKTSVTWDRYYSINAIKRKQLTQLMQIMHCATNKQMQQLSCDGLFLISFDDLLSHPGWPFILRLYQCLMFFSSSKFSFLL